MLRLSGVTHIYSNGTQALSNELDSYLRTRGGGLLEELPLTRMENQSYIHYRKGYRRESVILMARRTGRVKSAHVISDHIRLFTIGSSARSNPWWSAV